MPPRPNFTPYLIVWWKNLGFGQRFILFLQVLLTLIDSFGYSIMKNMIQKTQLVSNGDFWRLLTTPYYSTGYLQIFINWSVFQLVVNSYETKVGSAFFLFDFHFKNLVLRTTFHFVNYGLAQYDPSYYYTVTYGLNSLTTYYLLSFFVGSPFSKTSFHLFSITNYIFIFAIPFLTFFISNNLIYLFAFQLAIFEWYFFDGMLIRMSNNYIDKLSSLFGSFRTISCFKQPQQNLREPKQYGISTQDIELQQKDPNQDFGGRGIKIGSDQTNQTQQRQFGDNNYQQI